MKKEENKRKLRKTLRWIAWVIAIQFVLFNISAAFYANKFTHLYTKSEGPPKSVNRNDLLGKTWRLFSGYKNYRSTNQQSPPFQYSLITLKTASDIALEAWYCPVDSSRGTVILFHGLMGNKNSSIPSALEFLNLGYSVMLMESRGHREETGPLTTIGYREAEEVKLAYDFVKQKGEGSIYMWGISMGAVEIIKAVAEYGLDPAGLILEMPFGSLQNHIKGRVRSIGFPSQPASFFITFWIGVQCGFDALGFRLAKYAAKIYCPVLLQYGTNDHLVKRSEIDEIYNAISSRNKELVLYEGANHQYLLGFDPVTWRIEVEDFLKKTR